MKQEPDPLGQAVTERMRENVMKTSDKPLTTDEYLRFIEERCEVRCGKCATVLNGKYETDCPCYDHITRPTDRFIAARSKPVSWPHDDA
jgi:hypothetical protein